MRRFLLFLLLACGLRAQTPTLQNFGYESIKPFGKPARGTVPLLVFTVQFTGFAPMLQSTAAWDQLIFPFTGPGGARSVNGYYNENSMGQFYFTRALVTTPPLVSLSTAETSQVMTPGYDSDNGRKALFGLLSAKTGVDWTVWDTNGDNLITQGELCILVLTNFVHPVAGLGNREAHARPLTWLPPVPPPQPPKTLSIMVTLVCHRASLMTIVHEMAHCLHVTPDLYGNDFNRNYQLSLMGATIVAPHDDRRSYHLDPWTKMRLGWLRPRIFNLDAGGLVRLRCPQSPFAQTEAEGPVILYSASRGKDEYFLLEWRNGNPPAGRGYDAHVEAVEDNAQAVQTPEMPGSGLGIWHIRQNADHMPSVILGGSIWSAYHVSPAVTSPPAALMFNHGAFHRGGRFLWDALTPPLIWQDGAATGIVVLPHPSDDGGNSIRVEWLSGAAHWGDFFSGLPSPNGTFANPWQTIATAVHNTPRGATLNLKSSSTAAGIVIDKRLIIQASHNGPAVIGQ